MSPERQQPPTAVMPITSIDDPRTITLLTTSPATRHALASCQPLADELIRGIEHPATPNLIPHTAIASR